MFNLLCNFYVRYTLYRITRLSIVFWTKVLIINAWASGRNPKSWEAPEEFCLGFMVDTLIASLHPYYNNLTKVQIDEPKLFL